MAVGDFAWEAGTSIATIVLAVATIVLAATSLFQDRIQRWLRRAELRVEIGSGPPDTHQIEMTDVRTGSPLFKAIYVRARVAHVGGPSAENVELVALGVWDLDGETRTVRESFLPLSLLWSHFGTVSMRIPEGLFRHCDVGRFQRDDSGDTVFLLSTVVQPNRVSSGTAPNVLPAGSYEIELLQTGDNTSHKRTFWRLTFEPEWSDDEPTMLGRIGISDVTGQRAA